MRIIGGFGMSFVEKMDVIDLIIETLKEHERVLDELACRIEACLRGAQTGGTPEANVNGEDDDSEDWR